MGSHEVSLSPQARIDLYGITESTWGEAKTVGWRFLGNVGIGNLHQVEDVTRRGFTIKLGDPMTEGGPRTRYVPESPDMISTDSFGVYIFRGSDS